MQQYPVALFCIVVAAWIAGCEPNESPTSDDGRVTIGVTLLTEQHQFYQQLRNGMETTAAEHDYKLIITSAEGDSARQSNQVDEFIVQKVDALIVCPCDSKSVGAAIRAANIAKIPVFTADIANLSSVGEVTSHIASDNKAGGREAARMLGKAIGHKGSVAILSHPQVASVSDRVKGFREQIKLFRDVEVVAELSADGKRDKAMRVTEDLLQSHPDLTGIFAINDDTALGALAAVEAANRKAKVRIVGYDATPEARKRIDAGDIYGDVIQHPQRIGELTIQTIHDFLNGQTPPSVIPVEVGTYTGKDG